MNIFSLGKVKSQYCVTYDSASDNQFMVHKPHGTTKCFKESCHGLYYHDTSEHNGFVTQSGVAMVNMVAENATQYTNANYS